MQGVDYPVLGISDTGDTQMMYPDQDYKFDGNKVTEYPMMQEGGWLSKYQEKAPSDATRVAAPIRPFTKKEQEENARINKQTQKNTEELNKAIVADRKSKRETKGDVNVPGSFNIAEKARLFPESVGGVGEIIDEYLNPGTVIGTLADSLGESIAARSPEGVAATLAMTAGAGALGFDPLGSGIKGIKKAKGVYNNFVDDAVKAGANSVKGLNLTKSQQGPKLISNFDEYHKQRVAEELSKRHGSLKINPTTGESYRVVSPNLHKETLSNYVAFSGAADKTLNKAGDLLTSRYSDNLFNSSLEPINNQELLKGVKAGYRKNQNGGWLNKYK
jgi:hypothetical protein